MDLDRLAFLLQKNYECFDYKRRETIDLWQDMLNEDMPAGNYNLRFIKSYLKLSRHIIMDNKLEHLATLESLERLYEFAEIGILKAGKRILDGLGGNTFNIRQLNIDKDHFFKKLESHLHYDAYTISLKQYSLSNDIGFALRAFIHICESINLEPVNGRQKNRYLFAQKYFQMAQLAESMILVDSSKNWKQIASSSYLSAAEQYHIAGQLKSAQLSRKRAESL